MQPTPTIDDPPPTPWDTAEEIADDGAWPDTTDVLVIGGGVAGISVALGLARRGTAVLLVDPHPANGASGRGAGLVYTGLSEHPARVAGSLGPQQARALYRLARRSVGLLDRWVTPVDQLWIAVDPREEAMIDDSVRTLAGFGFDVAPVAADDGIPQGRRGFRMAGDGLVDPRGTLDHLLAEARAAGARICRGRVDAVTEDARGLMATIGQQTVRAEIVVYTAGTGGVPIEPYFEDKLWSVREQALRIRGPSPEVAGRAGFGWTWFRPMPGGTLVGGCRWATPHLEVGETSPVPTDGVQDRIEAFARRHFGADVPIDARWAWIEAHSCDGLPLVGPLPGQVRRVACTGFCGNDWGLGPACANLVVDGLLGGPADTPAMFAANRFLA